jgi:thiamine phosphate synthase YjbQ (UPF0047 family)
MKYKTEYLTFNTPTRRVFVNITPNVRKIIEKSGIKDGLWLKQCDRTLLLVFFMPLTSASGSIFSTSRLDLPVRGQHYIVMMI